MKKILAFVVMASASVFSLTYAATPSSIAELLQNASFGYSDTVKLSVDDIDTSKITLKSPIIRDVGGEYVTEYRTTYSIHMVEELAVMDAQALAKALKTKTTVLQNWGEGVTITLGVADGLEATGTYYLMVTPIDMYDDLGTSSQPICFNLEKELYAIGSECLRFAANHAAPDVAPTSSDPTLHSAPLADMTLANITHSINGNTITLKWTAVGENPDVDIFLFDLKEERYIRVATVKMSNERYDYEMKWDGEHVFRFVPLDRGREMVYNVQAMTTTPTPPEPKKEDPVVTPVQVGPAENIAIALLLSGIGYIVYRRYLKRY